MKNYYIYYPRNFANEYRLFYVEKGSEEEKAIVEWQQSLGSSEGSLEKIAYAQARQYCISENERRKYNPTFSGRADRYIYPYIPGSHISEYDLDLNKYEIINYCVVDLNLNKSKNDKSLQPKRNSKNHCR